jgi:NAD(P)-dependent dehydrogenase (short-subunit alcohol dehydrogenase family)
MLNITVNVVQGGTMPTDMAEASADQVPATVLDRHPIRRIASLEEVVAAWSSISLGQTRHERWRALLTRCASRRLWLSHD